MLLAEELHEDKNLQIDLLDIQVAKNRYHQTIEYIEAIECSVPRRRSQADEPGGSRSIRWK